MTFVKLLTLSSIFLCHYVLFYNYRPMFLDLGQEKWISNWKLQAFILKKLIKYKTTCKENNAPITEIKQSTRYIIFLYS
jgi:hypothetical protein